MMNIIYKLAVSRLLLVSLLSLPISALAHQESACPVDKAWLANPSMPTEVAKSGSDGSSTFCDFYQFSTQAFLYLMSPATENSSQRNFQVDANFPSMEYDTNGVPQNACDGYNSMGGSRLKTSLAQSHPSTGQAGGDTTIYAQDGNVVYYTIRFNKDLCDLTGSAVEMQKQNLINFPPGTTELKFAWKKLSPSEITSKRFVVHTEDSMTLGLIGMHVVIATKDHPEFIWATYEHKNNSPNCEGDASKKEWMFADATCAQAGLKSKTCDFNHPTVTSSHAPATGTPTNICRVFSHGTGESDNKHEQNVTAITQQHIDLLALLNEGYGGESMQVLKNYFTVGALWVSDIKQSSGGQGVPNERGSLRLANSVAETTYQNVTLYPDKDKKEFTSNCFGCHNYKGNAETVNNNITAHSLSHIFKDIKLGQGQAVDVSTNTISNNTTAPGICNKACSGNEVWNGNWTNINASAGSVCGCILKE